MKDEWKVSPCVAALAFLSAGRDTVINNQWPTAAQTHQEEEEDEEEEAWSSCISLLHYAPHFLCIPPRLPAAVSRSTLMWQPMNILPACFFSLSFKSTKRGGGGGSGGWEVGPVTSGYSMCISSPCCSSCVRNPHRRRAPVDHALPIPPICPLFRVYSGKRPQKQASHTSWHMCPY